MIPPETQNEAIERAQLYFLTEENTYGCAETTYIVLNEIYGFSDARDSSIAMALNGGIAWSGSVCGVLLAAALALGRLSAKRIDDHRQAKTISRQLVRQLMEEFRNEFGILNCRELINRDISEPDQHQAFIQSGVWKDTCMRLIEFVVLRLFCLKDEDAWESALEAMKETRGGLS